MRVLINCSSADVAQAAGCGGDVHISVADAAVATAALVTNSNIHFPNHHRCPCCHHQLQNPIRDRELPNRIVAS
jgi:hypothetical protein